VPISTIRDFVFTDDVALRISAWLSSGGHSGGPQVKLLASGRSVTLGHTITMVRSISRARARVLLSANANTLQQPSALRFQSRSLLELEASVPGRTLEEGIRSTWASTVRDLQQGELSR
jgi:nucleoside-diphosphate-sugar epimerase